MKENLGWVLITIAMLVTIIVLHGCTTHISGGTGLLRCFGYCQLEMASGMYRSTVSGDEEEEESTKSGFNLRGDVQGETDEK